MVDPVVGPLEAAEDMPPGVGVDENRAGLAAIWGVVTQPSSRCRRRRRSRAGGRRAPCLIETPAPDETDAIGSRQRYGATGPARPAVARTQSCAGSSGDRERLAIAAEQSPRPHSSPPPVVVVDRWHGVDRIDVDRWLEGVPGDRGCRCRQASAGVLDCRRAARAIRSPGWKTCR